MAHGILEWRIINISKRRIPLKLTKDERESILVTLEVFGIYPRAVYEKYTDERLLEEYERIVGR
nr:MAG TPA: hypothetical protein [Caudoviricetes sp.]